MRYKTTMEGSNYWGYGYKTQHSHPFWRRPVVKFGRNGYKTQLKRLQDSAFPSILKTARGEIWPKRLQDSAETVTRRSIPIHSEDGQWWNMAETVTRLSWNGYKTQHSHPFWRRPEVKFGRNGYKTQLKRLQDSAFPSILKTARGEIWPKQLQDSAETVTRLIIPIHSEDGQRWNLTETVTRNLAETVTRLSIHIHSEDGQRWNLAET